MKKTIIYIYLLIVCLFSSHYVIKAQTIEITQIGEGLKYGRAWNDTIFMLNKLQNTNGAKLILNPKIYTKKLNLPLEKQTFLRGIASQNREGKGFTFSNVPQNMRIGLYNWILPPYRLVALGKTWYKGYKGNFCFFGTRSPHINNRELFGAGFLLEEIDDFVSLESKSENPNKIPFLDSLAFLTQKNIQNQKENLFFLQGASEKNNIQLQIIDENKSIKIYLLEKLSGKKIEVFATKDFNFQKKQKTELETKIQKILALYMIPWDNPLPPKNTNANVRVIWKQPIKLVCTNKNFEYLGFPLESQMLINNLTILTNNILVRQQNYENAKFDILDTKPNDNFAGKTIELDITLEYDRKFNVKNNIERKNNYVLTITANNKKYKIIWKENRIANNDNTENLFELIEIIQNIIYKK